MIGVKSQFNMTDALSPKSSVLRDSSNNILRDSSNITSKPTEKKKAKKATTSPSVLACSNCKVSKPRSKDAFTKTQLSKGDTAAVCRECQQKKLKLSRTCQTCDQIKHKLSFSNKQWKMHGSCTDCIEMKLKNKEPEKTHKQCDCCQKYFLGTTKDSHCEQCSQLTWEEQENLKEARLNYYLTYGVGYRPMDGLSFGQAIASKVTQDGIDDLEGDFDIVFYSSDNKSDEHISRTARGIAHFSKQNWKGQDVLHGAFAIDTRSTNNDPARIICEEAWGEETQGRFIQIPQVDSLKDLRGDHLFQTGSKTFISDRGGNDPRWYDRSFFQNGRFEKSTGFCHMTLSIVKEHVALEFQPDRLHGIDFVPQGSEVLGQNSTDSAEMTSPLNIQERAKSVIREFVAPQPALFLNPGDVVLEIEETLSTEWTKFIVLRKKNV